MAGSFSLCMAHGGTSFGLWGGCGRPFRLDTSSDDYDAPIDQSSWTIGYAHSEESGKEDGSALNAINGQVSDHWISAYSGKAPTA